MCIRKIFSQILLYFVIAVICFDEGRGLTFLENIFIGLSGACRAIMNIQEANSRNFDPKILKQIQILHAGTQKITSMKIDEAYKAVKIPENRFLDISKETKIIIHGFNDNAKSSVPMRIAIAYAEKELFNVFLVDVSTLIKDNYITSAALTKQIGRRLANFLANLETFGMNSADYHIIGISLGAQIAGWIGKYFFKYKMKKIGKITGLDPAGPCFTYAPGELRLDKEDAEFVEVIHVNKMVQGVLEPIGHVDYFVNGGGPSQPGCFGPSCSHMRASLYFEESIKIPKAFVGVKCRTWEEFLQEKCDKSDMVVMGYGSNKSNRGIYYLRTSSDSPFGLGMKGVEPNRNKMKSLAMMFNDNEIDMPLTYNK